MFPRGRKLKLESLEQRRLLAADISLVRYFDIWDGGTIKSTDAAGLTYHPGSGHLYIADSEINEMPQYFVGDNIFEVSLRGDVVHREISSNNSEPTGITYNEFDGFFYVTNDNTKKIYRYDDRLNTPLAIVDTRDAVAGAKDPEGITSDPETGMLYVVDGAAGGLQVLAYNADLQFQYRFSIAGEMRDGEGIAFEPVSRNLFIVSAPDKAIFEYTLDGTYLKRYDLSGISPLPKAPQGLVFAPTSDPDDDPNRLSLYMADAMKDNYPDGRIYEVLVTGLAETIETRTVEVRVAASSDDAEEQPSGSISTTSSDLELVHDRYDQIVGVRFAGVDIPQGASIVNAYIQFQVDEASSGKSALVVQGEGIDNAPTFTTTKRNISSRTRTSTSVDWSPPAWNTVGDAGPDQRTPDLSSIIQQIIDRPGWAAGNALALIITGTGARVAEAFDGKSSAAPLLRIEFSTDEQAENQPPQVDAGADQTVVTPNAATLDGTASDDGLPGDGLTTVWTKASGPGTVAFADASSPQTTATFSAPGTYVLRLTASDGELTSSDNVTVTVLAETIETHTVEVRVAASSDDAEEQPSGSISTTSSDLELVHDRYDQIVGVRFAGVDIPQGASIVNAYIQFQVDEASSGESALVVQGEGIDNAPTFTTTKRNISSRTRTSTSVDWSPPAWNTVGDAGPDQRTPDLSSIIQQIIDRPGWNAGNALALIITGTGARVAEAFDGKSSAAPLLHVEYAIDGTTGSAQLTSSSTGEGESLLQNQNNRMDVNNDGEVSPIDSLLVLNRLNRRSGEGESSSTGSKHYLDVNGDNIVSPLDALQVINFLNRASSTVAGEGKAAPPLESGASLANPPRDFDATDSFFDSLGNSPTSSPITAGTDRGSSGTTSNSVSDISDQDADNAPDDDFLTLLAEDSDLT